MLQVIVELWTISQPSDVNLTHDLELIIEQETNITLQEYPSLTRFYGESEFLRQLASCCIRNEQLLVVLNELCELHTQCSLLRGSGIVQVLTVHILAPIVQHNIKFCELGLFSSTLTVQFTVAVGIIAYCFLLAAHPTEDFQRAVSTNRRHLCCKLCQIPFPIRRIPF